MRNTTRADSALPVGPILQAVLPLPPSANGMYKNVPGVGRVSTAELLLFKEEALYRLNFAASETSWKAIELLRINAQKKNYLPLKLEIIICCKTMWKSDLDNRIKALQDTIFQFMAMPKEDFLVVELDAKKRANPSHPHCKFRLSFAEIGGEEW